MKTKSQKILMFVANEYEDIELQYPKFRFAIPMTFSNFVQQSSITS